MHSNAQDTQETLRDPYLRIKELESELQRYRDILRANDNRQRQTSALASLGQKALLISDLQQF